MTLEEYEVLGRAMEELDMLLARLKERRDVLSAEQWKKSLGVLFDAQEILVDESERRYGYYDISELLHGPNVLVFRRDQPIGRV